ncbi:MAG: M4 family metallopeptidase [Kofleriaceae bacterium]|nr:M4 family metallopeptidase [Kofleriaceae bacterium]MCB9570521.1 M4 family metallopeptidase [Kofleriaceae bacterium]
MAALAGCALGHDAPDGTSSAPPTVETVRFTDKVSTPLVGVLDTAALDYVRNTPELTLSAEDDWHVRAAGRGADGLNHVRLEQLHDGVKVWGGDLVLHASDDTFKAVNGTLVANLDGFDTTPTLGGADALAVAQQAYASGAKDTSAVLAYDRESTELVIFPMEGRDARLAWHAVFFTELQGGLTPGLWNYFIDAKTGDILDSYNGIHTLSQASGPGGNAKVSRTWTNELDVEASGSSYAMNTTQYRTTNMNHGTSGTGTTVTGSLSNIGDAAINDAHGFAEKTVRMMQEWVGHNSIDDNGFKIVSRVHYSNSYENAFWDGTQMTYGDGASYFYPLSGDPDVVGHEINHGFTSFHSNLNYSGIPGGLNESFSDIAGTMVEFYTEGNTADFDLGRDIFKGSGALRYMCNPTADGASIDNAANYTNGLDVHYSSGVMNKAFCLSAKRLGSGSPTGAATADSVKRAGAAFYEANASYWTTSTGWTAACQGVVDAAGAMGYSATEIAALTQSWADVGVTCGSSQPPPDPTPTCDETLTGASGSIQSPNYPNAYGNNYTHTWCIQPSNGQPATLTFDAFNTEAGYDFVTISDANGTQLSKTAGTTAPAAATSTKLVVKFASDASVTGTGFHANWTTGGTTNQAPTVQLTAPADGATVTGSVTVTATAADSDGSVAKVTFQLPDGTTVDDTTAPYSTTWNSATVADGAGYLVKATAVDNLGAASAVASRMISVSNSVGCLDGVFASTDTPIGIPDNNSTGITSRITVSGTGNVGALELSLDITHTWRGDLVVTLVSPSGTSYTVSNRSGGSADNIILTNSLVSAFNGQAAAGVWQLKVSDRAGQDVGTLNSWSLAISGDCQVPPPGGWSGSASPNLALVDNGQACTTLNVAGDGNAADVKLDLAGTHAWRSILRGTLSHGGVTVEAFPTGTFPSNAGSFSLTSRAVSGLSGSATGAWTLCIVDTDAYGDTGTLATWAVHD